MGIYVSIVIFKQVIPAKAKDILRNIFFQFHQKYAIIPEWKVLVTYESEVPGNEATL